MSQLRTLRTLTENGETAASGPKPTLVAFAISRRRLAQILMLVFPLNLLQEKRLPKNGQT